MLNFGQKKNIAQMNNNLKCFFRFDKRVELNLDLAYSAETSFTSQITTFVQLAQQF